MPAEKFHLFSCGPHPLDSSDVPYPTHNMSKQYFPKIGNIQFEGPGTKNPLAFQHYNPGELVEGKSMKEHLRFAVVYWHTMRGTGGDMFGWGTAERPWNAGEGTVKDAVARAHAMFEFTSKVGAPLGLLLRLHLTFARSAHHVQHLRRWSAQVRLHQRRHCWRHHRLHCTRSPRRSSGDLLIRFARSLSSVFVVLPVPAELRTSTRFFRRPVREV